MAKGKTGVQNLVEICINKGIRKVVFSPGSRSAPLVIGFSQRPEVECLVIPDERVAGYFALGMAQQLNETVAVVCTSGTAVLNLAPAICEAFYQKVPLLILTADRPASLIGKGENQTIKQKNIFRNYVKESYSLPTDAAMETDALKKLVSGAIEASRNYGPGPVHINVPLKEPLYVYPEHIEAIRVDDDKVEITDNQPVIFSGRNMVVAGMLPPNIQLRDQLLKLSMGADTVVVTEPISNLQGEGFINNIDSALALMNSRKAKEYTPALLITIGGQIVSKRLRAFLKKQKPENHIHVSISGDEWNSFGAKNFVTYKAQPEQFLQNISSEPEQEAAFNYIWKELSQKAEQATGKYYLDLPYSDLKVFETLTASFPPNSNIQYGNSTPIRYASFFKHTEHVSINSNRGTSGIDGCVSTAAGAAYANNKITIAIVGDVSFLYDSNALWNNYLSPQLRIIVINNSGGNIFRLINGPTKVAGYEKFFETTHNLRAEQLASMYGITYYFCSHQNELEDVLPVFYRGQQGKPAILEIKTDGVLSAEVFKGYFDFIKANK